MGGSDTPGHYAGRKAGKWGPSRPSKCLRPVAFPAPRRSISLAFMDFTRYQSEARTERTPERPFVVPFRPLHRLSLENRAALKRDTFRSTPSALAPSPENRHGF